ncbi:ribosome recycling factor [Patescibacteria group bacterium]
MDLEEVRKRMGKTIVYLTDELTQIKTGRATPSLVEKITVDAYETKMPLVELATITAPEPNEIIVSPFDASIIKNIEKAISQRQELGLSPQVDDQLIRIRISPLTEEKRQELVRILNQKLETGRVAVRQIRHEMRSLIKQEFEDKEIGEDERKRQEDEAQKVTDEYNQKIGQLGMLKQKEILGE